MKHLTYLIYVLFSYTFLFGGTAYIVFILGHSGWWFLLTLILSDLIYSPRQWIHGFHNSEKESNDAE